jgi:hypothetical protein
VDNFVFNLGDQLVLGVPKIRIKGPIKAYVIPAHKSVESSLYLKLPTKLDANYDYLEKAFLFGQNFGQTEFNFTYDFEQSYDSANGIYKLYNSNLKGENLMALKSELELSGITEAFVAQLKQIPLTEAESLLAVPGIMDVGLNNLVLEYTDQSLYSKIIAANAKFDEISPAEVQAKVENGFKEFVTSEMEGKVENSADFLKAGLEFLGKPGSFSVGLKPNPPFSGNFVAQSSLIGEQSLLFNALNLFYKTGTSDPVTLVFKTNALNSEPDLLEEDLFMEEEIPND